MLFGIRILYFLVLTTYAMSGKQCSCSELNLERECLYAGCQWVINESNNSCKHNIISKQPICSNFDDQLVCDFIQECAWNNQGKCELFTQCSDYRIDPNDSSDRCYLKHHSCLESELDENGFVTCQSLNEICEKENVKFYHLSKPLQNQTIQNCLRQRKQEKNCSQIKNEVICSFIQNDDRITICTWKHNQCIEAKDVSQLSANNCYLNTGGMYAWNQDQCLICDSDFSQENQTTRLLSEIQTQTTNIQSSSTYESNITFSSVSRTQINCNITLTNYETLNCENSDCSQNQKSTETIDCLTMVDSSTNITSSNVTYCETNTQIANVQNSSTNQNSTITTSCNSTVSSTTKYDEIVMSTTTAKSQLNNACTSNLTINSATNQNSVQKCKQVINNSETVKQNENTIYNNIKTNCDQSQQFSTMPDDIYTKTQIISSFDCITITNNDQNTQIQKTINSNELRTHDKTQINSTSSEYNNVNNTVTTCITNAGDYQNELTNQTAISNTYKISTYFYTECIAIINNDQINSIPTNTLLKDNIIKTITVQNFTKNSSESNGGGAINNCTNSNCTIIIGDGDISTIFFVFFLFLT